LPKATILEKWLTADFNHHTSSSRRFEVESSISSSSKDIIISKVQSPKEEEKPERGSPSLVGRGIANPQEDRLAEEFESYLKEVDFSPAL
jgi:hypothetical protein